MPIPAATSPIAAAMESATMTAVAPEDSSAYASSAGGYDSARGTAIAPAYHAASMPCIHVRSRGAKMATRGCRSSRDFTSASRADSAAAEARSCP